MNDCRCGCLQSLEGEEGYGRGSNEEDSKADGERRPLPLTTCGSKISCGCLAQAKRQCEHQDHRPRRHFRAIAGRLNRSRAFFLGQWLRHGGRVGDRVLALIEGQFVLQAPAKNRDSQYEQPKREQHGTTAILWRTAKNLHAALTYLGGFDASVRNQVALALAS